MSFFILARYNIPPIRAVDLSTHRGHHRPISNIASSSLSPPPIAPIGRRRKSQSKSSMNSLFFFFFYCLLFLLGSSESNLSTTNFSEIRQSHVTCSSPPSSYAASSSHVAEIDDYDCDLDSGYNDEFDSPLLPPSTYLIPTSPWYDIPIADELFIWVIIFFQMICSSFSTEFDVY